MNLLREEDYTTTLVKVGHADIDELIKVFNSMISRLRDEKITIREQNHFLDLLITSSPMGLLVTSFDDDVTSMNPAAEKILGVKFAEVRDKKITDLPRFVANGINNMKFGEKLSLSKGNLKYLVRKDSFVDQGFSHPFYLFEELSDEIRMAEKDAYGKVIRMMVHEVNNTVGAVNSIISAIESNPGTFNPDHRDEAASILKVAIERNSQLNRFMTRFSDIVKLPGPEKSPYPLNDSLHSILGSYSSILKKNEITLNTELSSQSPLINADRSQMDQVLENILKNSIEAIGTGGTINVKTSLSPPRIIISDSGKGIDEEIRQQLFTPFFTTKTGGQGIGLTLVREILVNHGFNFDLHSLEGKTEFIIEF
jgi:two-component system, NtrC family, nitrogen regulation sensor histidine kinase NtrY